MHSPRGPSGAPTLVAAPPLPLHQPFVDSVGSAEDRAASLAMARAQPTPEP